MRIAPLIGLALLTGTPLPATAQPAQPVTIKLEPWRTRWVLPATIAGTSRKYLFDTGAGLTLVSRDTLKAAGCEPWGRMTGFQMMGQRGDTPRCEGIAMTVGGQALMPPALGTIAMGENNPKDAALDGVIGLNLFEDKIVTIDFAAGLLTIENEESRARRTAGMQPIRIRLKREVDGLALAVAAAVPTAKGTLWMELDSGNGGTILVSKPVAALVGMNGTVDGKQVAHFTVAGSITADTQDAFSPDMIMDGNLGMPFLRNWVVTLDLKNGLAWLGRPPVPPPPPTPLAG